MSTIAVFLGSIVILLILSPDYYRLSKVFRALKVLAVISLLLPILAVALLFSVSSDPAINGTEYVSSIFLSMLFLFIACTGGLASAWFTSHAYWLYAKKTGLFEISSLQLALMLIVAIAVWSGLLYLADGILRN